MVVLVVAALWGLANTLGSLVLAINGLFVESAFGLLSILAAYWFAMGAWRRTPWGLASAEDAAVGPPQLSHRRARVYVALAIGCVLAAGVAVSLQAFVLSAR